MPEQKVRIGFVGVGSMGQCAHLKNYVTVDGCEVVAMGSNSVWHASTVGSR